MSKQARVIAPHGFPDFSLLPFSAVVQLFDAVQTCADVKPPIATMLSNLCKRMGAHPIPKEQQVRGIQSLFSLLLPAYAQRNYGVAQATLPRFLIEQLDIYSKSSQQALKACATGNLNNLIAQVAKAIDAYYVPKSKGSCPDPTVRDVCGLLDTISSDGRDRKQQQTALRHFYNSFHVPKGMLLWLLRVILKDLGLSISDKVWGVFGKDCVDAFNSGRSLQAISQHIVALYNPSSLTSSTNANAYTAAPSSGASLRLHTGFSPMLASRLDLKNLVSRVGSAVWCVEDKLDGERMLVHIDRTRNPPFRLFSRAVRERTAEYGFVFARDVFPCLPQRVDKCVLDGELMAAYEDTFVRMRHLRSVAGYNPKLGKNVQINISEDKPVLPKSKGLSVVADDDASSGDDGDVNAHTSNTTSTSSAAATDDALNMVHVSACRLQLHVFDVPVYQGRDISKMPYYARRALLAHLLRDEDDADGAASGVSSVGSATGSAREAVGDVKVDIEGGRGTDAGTGAGVRAGLEALGGDDWDDDLMWDEPDPAASTAAATHTTGNGNGTNNDGGISVGGALGDDEALVAARQGVVLCHQFLLHTDDASAEDMSIAEQLRVTRISIPRDAKSVQQHLLACLAASELRANEGLVLKSLRSPYQLGPNRAQAWLKLKRDLIGQGPSADCVLIGLDQSSKRTNTEMDKFVLGLPVEREGRRVFYSFVRLGNLSGEMRARLRRLAGTALPYNPRAPPPHLAGVPVDGLRYYYPSPSVVVEAYCYQLSFNASDPAGFTAALACRGVGIASKSQVSTCGVSMRFPRFKAIREDKTLADCDTVESVVALASSVAAVDADDALTEHYCAVMREQVDAQGGVVDRTGRISGLGVGGGAGGSSSGIGSVPRSPRSPRSPRVPMSPARSRGGRATGSQDATGHGASGGVSGVSIRPDLTLLSAFGGPSLTQWDLPPPSQSQSLLLSSGPLGSDASSSAGVSVEASLLDVAKDAKASDAAPAAGTDETASALHLFPPVGKRFFPIFRSPAEMAPQEREAYLQRHPYLRQCLPPTSSPAAEAERRIRAQGREAIAQMSLTRRRAMMWPLVREDGADERTFEASPASHASALPPLQSPWRVPPRTRQLASALVPAPPTSLLPSSHAPVSSIARASPTPVTATTAFTSGGGAATGFPVMCPPATAAERVVLATTQRWVAMLPATTATLHQEGDDRERRPLRPRVLDTGSAAVLGVVRLLRSRGLGIVDGPASDPSASVKLDVHAIAPSPPPAAATGVGLNVAAGTCVSSLLVKAEPVPAVASALVSPGLPPPHALRASQHPAASPPHSLVSLTSSASSSTTALASTATSAAASGLSAGAASTATVRPPTQSSAAASSEDVRTPPALAVPASEDAEDAVEAALRELGTKRSRKTSGAVSSVDVPRKRARTGTTGTAAVAAAHGVVAGSDEDDDVTVLPSTDSSSLSLDSDPLSASLPVDHPLLALLHRLWRKGQLPAGLSLPPPAVLVAAQAASGRVLSSTLPSDTPTKHITSLPAHIQTFIAAIPPLPLPPSLSFALLALCLQYQVNPEILAAFSEQQLRRIVAGLAMNEEIMGALQPTAPQHATHEEEAQEPPRLVDAGAEDYPSDNDSIWSGLRPTPMKPARSRATAARDGAVMPLRDAGLLGHAADMGDGEDGDLFGDMQVGADAAGASGLSGDASGRSANSSTNARAWQGLQAIVGRTSSALSHVSDASDKSDVPRALTPTRPKSHLAQARAGVTPHPAPSAQKASRLLRGYSACSDASDASSARGGPLAPIFGVDSSGAAMAGDGRLGLNSPPPATPARQGNGAGEEEEEEEGDIRDIFLPQRAPSALGARDGTPTRLSKRARSLVLQGILQGASDAAVEDKAEVEVTHVFPNDRTCVFAGLSVQVRSDAYVYLPPQVSLVQVEELPVAPDQVHGAHVPGYGMQPTRPTPAMGHGITSPEYFLQIPETFDFSEMMYPSSRGPHILDNDSAAREAPGRWVHLPRVALESLLARAGARVEPGCDARAREGVVYLYGVQALTQPVKHFLASSPLLLTPQWAIECLLRGSLCSPERERAAAALYLQRLEAVLADGDAATPASVSVDAAVGAGVDVSELAAQFTAERAAILQHSHVHPHQHEQQHAHPHMRALVGTRAAALSDARVSALASVIADSAGGTSRDYRVLVRKRQYLFTCPPALRPPSLALALLSIPPHVIISLPANNTPHVDLSSSLRAATMSSLALPPALGGHASACTCQRVRQWLQDQHASPEVRMNGSRSTTHAVGEQRLCAHLSDMWRAYTSTSRVAAVTTALAQAPLAELALLSGDEVIGSRGAKRSGTASSPTTSSSFSSPSSSTPMNVPANSTSPAPLLSSAAACPPPPLGVLSLPQPPLVPSMAVLTLRSQAGFPVYTPYLPAAAAHSPSPASLSPSTPLAAAPAMLPPPLRVLFCRAALAHWLCRWVAFACGKVTEAAATAADCALTSTTGAATGAGAPAASTMSPSTTALGAAGSTTKADTALRVEVQRADSRLLDANNTHGTPTPYHTYLWLLTHLTRRVCTPCAELQRDTSHAYNRAESADTAVLCLCQLPAPTLPVAIEQLRGASSTAASSAAATEHAAVTVASASPDSQSPAPSLTLPATLLHPLHSALALLMPTLDMGAATEGSGKAGSRKPKATVTTANGNGSAPPASLPWRAQQERLATPTAHALLPLAQLLSSSSTAAPQTEVGMALARTATGTQHCGEQLFAVQLVLLCGLRVVAYHAVHAAAERMRRYVSRGILPTPASRGEGTPSISVLLPPLPQLLSLSTHALYTPYALLCTYRALRCLDGCTSEVANRSGDSASWQQRLGIAMHMAKSAPTQRGQAYSASYTRQRAPTSRAGGLVKTDGPYAEHESSSGPASDPHGSLDASQPASQRRQQSSQSHDSLGAAGSQTATLDAFLSSPTGAADEWHAPVAEAAKQATTTALKVLLDRNRGVCMSGVRKSSNGRVLGRSGSGSGDGVGNVGVPTSGNGDLMLTGVINVDTPSPESISALSVAFTCLLELAATMHTTFRPSAPLSTAAMSLCACPATLVEYISTAFALPHAMCTALATLQHLRSQHPQPQPLRLASLQRAASTRLSQLRKATLFPPAPLHLLLAQLHTHTAAPLRLPFSPSLPIACPPLCGLTVWVDSGYVFSQLCGITPQLQPRPVVMREAEVGRVGEGADTGTVCYACAKPVTPTSVATQPLTATSSSSAATSSSSTTTSVFVSDGGCGNMLCFLTRHLHRYLSHSSLPSLPQRVCLAHTHFPSAMSLPPALPLPSSALDPVSVPTGPVHLLSSLLPAHALPRVSLAPYLAPHVLHTRLPTPLQRMVSVLEVAGAAITPALAPLLTRSHPHAHAAQALETKSTGGKSTPSPQLPAVRACLDALDRSQVWFGHAGVVIRDCSVNGSMDDLFPSHTSPAQPCHCYLCELRLLLSNLPDVCVLAVMQRKGGAQLPLQPDVLLSQYHQHVAHLRAVLDVAQQLFAADMHAQTTLLQQAVQRAYERGGMDGERARKTAEGHVQRAVRWVMRKLQGMRMVHTGWVTALQSVGETYDGDKRGTIEYAKFLVQPPSA